MWTLLKIVRTDYCVCLTISACQIHGQTTACFHNYYLEASKAPLESQVHGTILFTRVLSVPKLLGLTIPPASPESRAEYITNLWITCTHCTA